MRIEPKVQSALVGAVLADTLANCAAVCTAVSCLTTVEGPGETIRYGLSLMLSCVADALEAEAHAKNS